MIFKKPACIQLAILFIYLNFLKLYFLLILYLKHLKKFKNVLFCYQKLILNKITIL